jgi:hypothetical protein
VGSVWLAASPISRKSTPGYYYDANGNLTSLPVQVPQIPVSNPGFESGSVSPWIAWGGGTATATTTVAHSGNYSLALSAPASGGGAYQTITGLVPGQQYVASAWSRPQDLSATPRALGRPAPLGSGGHPRSRHWQHAHNKLRTESRHPK